MTNDRIGKDTIIDNFYFITLMTSSTSNFIFFFFINFLLLAFSLFLYLPSYLDSYVD